MSEGKGILGSVMGALFESDEAPTAVTPLAPYPASRTLPPTVVTTAAGAAPIIDQNLVDTIRSSTFAVSSDYATFIGAAKLLEGIIPDETMRLKAALASSKISAGQIANALTTTHAQALEGVVVAYKGERDKKFAKEVDAKLAEATRLGKDNKAIEQQVAQLQASVVANRAKQAELTGQAESARVLIEGTDANFATAQASVSGELTALSNKIKAL